MIPGINSLADSSGRRTHSVCTRNPTISVIIWFKPRDYARPPVAVTTNVNTRKQTETYPIPINQSARRRRRLSAKSCRDRVKNTSIKNSLKGLRTRRGAARSHSNLGHFPEQFEPNSTTLYIIRRPPIAPVRGPRRPLSPSCSHPHTTPTPVLLTLKSRHTENSVRAVVVAGCGAQSAGRTCANKIDFLSAR